MRIIAIREKTFAIASARDVDFNRGRAWAAVAA